MTSPASIYKVGDTVALDDFGGQIEINDGTLTTLKDLVNSSESGVVLFTYPKASTPGCKLSVFGNTPTPSIPYLLLLVADSSMRPVWQQKLILPRYEASLHVPRQL